MLWARPLFPTMIRLCAAIALSLPLSACLHPLYAPNALGTGDGNTRLNRVQVADMPDRLGHFLQAELQFRLGGGEIPADPLYRLEMKTRESTQVAIVNRNTDLADSASQVTYADYVLRSKDGKVMANGSVVAVASYDRSAQQYANVRASRNAEERAAKQLADQILIRLSAALYNREHPEGADKTSAPAIVEVPAEPTEIQQKKSF